MSRRSRDLFQTVRTEGGLLPPELLKRIAKGDGDLPGLAPSDYHLEETARLAEAVTRSWNRLLGAWVAFRDARATLAPGAPDAGLTRERWLLPLFQELGYGRLLAVRGGVEVDGKPVPLSHLWHRTPIHLVGFRTDIEGRTAGKAGAARQSPHSLVQSLLNRTPDYLWGFVGNGLQLRCLRDNASLTRQAYVEFDLEAMMEGEVYADFALLWLVCHQSRVEAERPGDCWLERWVESGRDQGTRALERLRGGVEQAIESLGQGFLAHAANAALRDALTSGALGRQDYYRQVLRLVYRLLFLFVAEDRGLLLLPQAPLEAQSRYREHYSTARLRRLAARRRGGPHLDVWRALRLVMEKLGDDRGCPELALPALGSFLWARNALPYLAGAELANEALLDAVRALAFTEDGRLLRPVDWRNLDSEELGSVYESLLELHPEVDAGAGRFTLDTAAGHERKTTGSYYTPEALVQCLLDTALDPVLDEACRAPDPEAVILDLTVCDPACGSGHFLIAAARRMARRLAQMRTDDDEPDPGALQKALRDVIGRCLYGVDVNPMAVELCKVSLWLEALEPGKPLSFLDHQIQCGNSLLGTTLALLAPGVPDDAFDPIEGDDSKVAAALKRRNRAERREHGGQETMFSAFVRDASPEDGDLAGQAARVRALVDDTIDAVHLKERAFARLDASEASRRERLRADAWCAAFVWPKTKDAPDAPTTEVLRRLAQDPGLVSAATSDEVDRIASAYGFLHWHVAFPEVLGRGSGAAGKGGFDVVLSNPPWEHTELKEKEFFAIRAPEIASAGTGAARKRLIAELEQRDPQLFAEYRASKRQHDAVGFFASASGRYPLCGRGRINTYAVFAETMRDLVGPTGRVGAIVPSGIATDDTTKFFFQAIAESGRLVSLYDFQSAPGLFGEIGHARYKFCLLTIAGATHPGAAAEFAFFLRSVSHLADPERRFRLSAADIALLNPNTRTCPVFRTRRDAELTKWIYRRVPVLVREAPPEENPWGVSFRQGLFNMTSGSHLFRTRAQLETEGWTLEGNVFAKDGERMLPLYEAKMVHNFDHRYGDYGDRPEGSENTSLPDVPLTRLQDPEYRPQSRYWVPETEVEERLAGKWDRGWLLGWRRITNATNERTVVATILPLVGAGDNIFLMLLGDAQRRLGAALSANLAAFASDYAARQKLGGTNLNFFIYEQLPILSPSVYESVCLWNRAESVSSWVESRVRELVFTAWDLEAFARDYGYDGPPFRWDEERRFLLRCELDAAYHHLYLGTPEEWRTKGPRELLTDFSSPRDAVAHILDNFPIVRHKDEQAHGEYRTKRVILEIYDDMQQASVTGKAYRTRLDPPPADPRVAHPANRSVNRDRGTRRAR